jgi:hypothetical protein
MDHEVHQRPAIIARLREREQLGWSALRRSRKRSPGERMGVAALQRNSKAPKSVAEPTGRLPP